MKSARWVVLGLGLALAAQAAAQPAPAPSAPAAQPPPARPTFQFPDHMKNAKVLPQDMTAAALRDTMRGFSISLGVRCAYCHAAPAGGQGEPDFASDDNPKKDKARAMLRMVMQLNHDLQANIAPDARVSCYTCHRGSAHPAVAPPPVAAATPQPALAAKP